MLVTLYSDLHLERCRDYGEHFVSRLRNDLAEVVVLAGDILSVKRGMEPIKWFSEKFKHVVFTTGNHEHYSYEAAEVCLRIEDYISDNNLNNFHYLERRSVTIEGQRFIGGTLWYDMDPMSGRLWNTHGDSWIINAMPNWVFDQYFQTLKYLKQEVKPDDIVVTHMLPSISIVEDRWRGDPYNIFYASERTEEVINTNRPKAWLHGHSHGSIDRVVGDTRCIRNPFGYSHHGHIENPNFDEFHVVEL